MSKREVGTWLRKRKDDSRRGATLITGERSGSGANWLDKTLAPFPSSQFMSEVWNRRSLHVPGQTNKFRGLFSWDALNRILERHRLEPPRLRLEQAGRTESELAITRWRPARRGREISYIDVPTLYSHLRSGATLVLDSVDELHEPVKEFAEALERRFGAHVEANCYAAWGKTPGFGVHWDDHDLLVVQIAGPKTWQMFETARNHPLYRDVDPNLTPPTSPIWERTITPGDLIYIPRGHWHGATGAGEPTLHLTFGINLPSGIDFLTWLVDELRSSEIARQDIPAEAGPEAIDRFEKCLRDDWARYWSDGSVERYLRHRAAVMPARPHLSLPEGGKAKTIQDQTRLRFSGIAADVQELGGGEIVVRTLGREFKFASKFGAVLTALIAEPHQTVSRLAEAAKLPISTTNDFIDQLLAVGVVSRSVDE